jgi:hypothetical protein
MVDKVPRYLEDSREASFGELPGAVGQFQGVQGGKTLVLLHSQNVGLAWLFGVREDLVPWVPRHPKGGLACIPFGQQDRHGGEEF